MDFRKYGDTYYIRVDRDDEVMRCVLDVCAREGIASATFSGIGGCQSAEIQTFDPASGTFSTERIEGMLELVSINCTVITDDSGEKHQHAHALLAFERAGEHFVRGGHLKSATVRYTAEIELRPVIGGAIGYAHDEETGTGFWRFD